MDQKDTPNAEIVNDARADAREALSNKLASKWWTFFLRGLLAAGVGVLALFWPTGSISVLLQLVGVFLIVDGVLTLIGFGRTGPAMGFGIGATAIGLVLLIWPEGTARFAFFLLGAWAIVTGIGSLMTQRQMPQGDPERLTARNVGVVMLVIGLVLLIWPGTGLVALGWVIAFAALAVAVVMFWLANKFKRVNERLKMRVINP